MLAVEMNQIMMTLIMLMITDDDDDDDDDTICSQRICRDVPRKSSTKSKEIFNTFKSLPSSSCVSR